MLELKARKCSIAETELKYLILNEQGCDINHDINNSSDRCHWFYRVVCLLCKCAKEVIMNKLKP